MLPVLFAVLLSQAAPIPQVASGQAESPIKPADVVTRMASGDFAAVEAQFTDKMKAALPEAKLAETWKALTAQVGGLKQQLGTREQVAGGLRVAVVTCEFERAKLDVQVVYDKDGRIAGMFFRPATDASAYTPPSYAVASAFTEKDATIGSGKWTLPGTLTLPKGSGRAPAVVLVHGSGPNDRDESLGPNKPFRDLALGLASRGVAVLRYDKRTKVYGAALGADTKLTVKEEAIDDAIAAADMLAKDPAIDPRRIFVLGHSLGGMLIPRIGQADSKLAGLIVMAGAVRPLEQAILDQTRYLAEADGTVTAEEQVGIDEAQKLFDEVRALKPPDAKSGKLISGAPASYWLDLRGYDPPAAARSMKQPLLVLQGERDYQVTMDEFGMWKRALEGKPNVTFHSYPALNHLFIPGTGKSLPTEYANAGHVSEDVIRDIAAWIGAIR